MSKRAEDVEETRRRITEAAVRLHTTIGAGQTTISALAEEAGVTRLTVYRHFPTDDDLFRSCGAHWMREHPRPDVEKWRAIDSISKRARVALTELYDWFQTNGDDQLILRRDVDAMPAWAAASMREVDAHAAEALVAGTPLRGAARKRLRAAAGHAVSFDTWRSLVVDQGLDNEQAVALMVDLFTR